MDCSRRVLAIGSAFYDARSKFDPVLGVKGQIFAKLAIFLTLRQYILKSINRSDIKLSPACSPFNSVRSYVSLKFLDGIFAAHSVPEGNSVTLIGKIV